MTEYGSKKPYSLSVVSYPDLAQFLPVPTGSIVVHVRLYGDETVYSLPRCPIYAHMLSAIRRALHPTLQGASSSEILLLDSADHVVLTKTSWPFLCNNLYEIVVKRREPPQPLSHTLGDVIDLTEDLESDNEAPMATRRGDESRISRAPSPPPTLSNIRGGHNVDDATVVTTRRVVRSSSLRPPVRVRGASILPHVRQKSSIRRSLSRAVLIAKLSHEFGGFPKLYEHCDLEHRYKTRRTNHWIVPPKAKHPYVRGWLTGRHSDGLDPADKTWLGRHRLRCESRDERKLVDEGRELYNLLVRAHGKSHRTANKTWRRVRDKYVGPSHDFVVQWLRLCPTCNKRRK